MNLTNEYPKNFARFYDTIYQHLRDGVDNKFFLKHILDTNGKFIFDTFVPDLKQLTEGLNNVTDFEDEYERGKKLKRVVSTRPDIINQLINVHFKIEWEEDNKIMHEDWELPLRFFFRYELEHLMDRSNFNHYEILGDYDGNILNENSKEFILICRK